jgi:hypothetical protein
MKIHKLIKIGSNHKNFCEDYIFAEKLSETIIFAGVFDGCSSGTDSHFASALTAKIIKSEGIKKHKENVEKDFLKIVLFESLKKIKDFKNSNYLKTDELLSTIILLYIDIEKNTAEIIAIGDGFLQINGKKIKIDQENTPRYAAYYLDEFSDYESFENLLEEIHIGVKTLNLKDITISTDGILSFEKFEENENETDVFEFLTQDLFLSENNAMLGRKINILKTKYSLINQDDLGIVRVIF